MTPPIHKARMDTLGYLVNYLELAAFARELRTYRKTKVDLGTLLAKDTGGRYVRDLIANVMHRLQGDLVTARLLRSQGNQDRAFHLVFNIDSRPHLAALLERPYVWKLQVMSLTERNLPVILLQQELQAILIKIDQQAQLDYRSFQLVWTSDGSITEKLKQANHLLELYHQAEKIWKQIILLRFLTQQRGGEDAE